MAAGQGELREERRIVTALFADIVGSTGITERLDPEDARDVLGSAVVRVIEQVDALGGTVKDLAGDGVLALFGAPIAHEDDAERAVLCGLRITAAIADLAGEVVERWGIEDFSVRVGIETGRAVMGRVGGGSRVEYGATGDVLNTAARLQGEASPGTVLVGDATRAMVADQFIWQPARTFSLKGKKDPVAAAVALSYSPRRHGGGRVTAAPLVERSGEMESLGLAVQNVLGGRGTAVALVGEPGVGKSRLIKETRGLFTGHGLWLEAGAVSYGSSTPYLVYRNLLLSWLGLPVDAGRNVVRHTVEERAGSLPAPQGELLLSLLPVLTVAVDEGDSEVTQERVFEAVRELLGLLACERPVVLTLEDLHWSDPSSVALTETVLPVVNDRPLLVLLTTRPESHALVVLDRIAAMVADRFVRVDLRPLSRAGDRELLHVLLDSAELPRALEERLLDTTDGNPYFVAEQVRALVSKGSLEQTDNGLRFVGASDVALAPTIERALVARIDRLEDRERSALRAASVLGVRFDDALLLEVAGATDYPEVLAELEHREFIVSIADGQSEGRAHRFQHALVQESAYASLLKRERRQLHGRAAQALEAAFSGREDEIAATLGRHLAESGDAHRAVPYLRTAARAAATAYANEEAASLAREGLALLAETGHEPIDSPAIELHRIEGAAMRSLARYEEAVNAYGRALRLLPAEDLLGQARLRSVIGQILADDHRYLEALAELDVASGTVGDPKTTEEFDVWLAVLRATSSVLYWLADHERHSEMLRRAEPLVAEFATPEQQLSFYDSLRDVMLRRDGFLVSDELAALDSMLFEARRDSEDDETRAWAHFLHGFILMWRRDLNEAEPLLRKTMTAAEELGSAMLRSRALTYLMVTARLRGDVPGADAMLEEVHEAARDGGLLEYEAVAAATAAWIAYRKGDEDAVIAQGRRALDIWSALANRYPFDWMAGFPLMAVAVARRDGASADDLARQMLAEGQQALPPELGQPLLAGREVVAAGHPEGAWAAFEAAVEMAAKLHYL